MSVGDGGGLLESERQTLHLPPGSNCFAHATLVLVDDHDDVTAVATCTTGWPDRRCECGMYDLAWA